MYVGFYINIGLIALLIIAIIIRFIFLYKSDFPIDREFISVTLVLVVIIIVICIGFIKEQRDKIKKAEYAVQIINQEYNTQFTQEEYYFNQKLIEQIIKDKKNVTDESL